MKLPFFGSPPLNPLNSAALNLIAHGDSWIAGFYSSDAAHSLVSVASALVGIPILNKGVGGQSITDHGNTVGGHRNDLMYTLPIDVLPNLSTSKANVVFAFDLINQCVANGGDGDEAYLAMRTYYTALKAGAAAIGAKVHVVWMTAPPAFIGVTPDYYSQPSVNQMNAAMIVANTRLKATPVGACDSFVDWAAIPQFIPTSYAAAAFQATGVYSNIDNVHPNDAGHALLGAALAASSIRWRRRV